MLNERAYRILYPSYDTHAVQSDNVQNPVRHDREAGNHVRTRSGVQYTRHHGNSQYYNGETNE